MVLFNNTKNIIYCCSESERSFCSYERTGFSLNPHIWKHEIKISTACFTLMRSSEGNLKVETYNPKLLM